MSKKENAFYYSFTSPSLPSSSSNASTPSAPPKNMELAPPPYDEAVVPSSAATEPSPPPNRLSYDGYILDSSSPPFNPNLPPQGSTADYGPYVDNPTDGVADAPLLGNIQSRSQEYTEFAGRPAPPNYSLYRAKFKTVKEGVISRDKHINKDPEALVQFLYLHNTRPRMTIHFYGYHEETEFTTTSTRNSQGELVQERQPTTRRIDDFNFDFNISEQISTTCQGVYIVPDKETGDIKNLRDLCNEYVQEKNILKELKLTKEINWDFNGLTRALTTAIRNSGFYENIEISFQMENHEIIVKTDHDLSRWIDNKYIRFFFFITCLWVIAWPVIWLFKKSFGHKTLKSSWNMNISERDWYAMHVQEVVNSCKGTNVFFRSNNPRPSNVRFNGLFR